MDSLRFLLIHADASQSERISSALEGAHHTVLPMPSLDEASEALGLERFDAVLLGAAFADGSVAEFKAKLRLLAETQPALAQIPILSASAGSFAGQAGAEGNCCDGYFEEPLNLAALTDSVSRLSNALKGSSEQSSDQLTAFPVLSPEELEEQVGGDRELMVEIIDLFLEERKHQVVEMRECLVTRNWDSLSRLAHTIKGSLGSLHAPRARLRAQELELAARDQQDDLCGRWFKALEHDLEDLEPELVALRAVSV